MPLKTLIVVILRLYTIYLVIEGISQFVLVFQLYWQAMSATDESQYLSGFYSMAGTAMGLLLIAAILWFSAFRLAGLVTTGCETEISFAHLTREDLYAFAFVFLGIWFILATIPAFVQDTYRFFAYDFPLPFGSSQKGMYVWPFVGDTLQMTAAILCVWRAKTWARNLVRIDDDAASP